MNKSVDDKTVSTIWSTAKVGALLVFAAVVSGCAGTASGPEVNDTSAATTTTTTTTTTATTTTTEVTAEDTATEDTRDRWTVTSGDNLWSISEHAEVYGVAEQWPLLYKRNRDQIQDADLIRPGMVLEIPRDSSTSAISAAIKHAKTRGAWTLGAVELSDQQYLKNSP